MVPGSRLALDSRFSFHRIADAVRRNPSRIVAAFGVGSAYAVIAWLLGSLYQYPWQLPPVAVRLAATATATFMKYVARGCKPRFPEWTLRYELIRATIYCAMSNYGHHMLKQPNAALIRRQSELFGTIAGHFTSMHTKTFVTPFFYEGLEHLWVRRAGLVSSTARDRVVLLYFHGGGYVFLSPRMYSSFGSELQSRIARVLDKKLGVGTVEVDVLLANYRKAPEHPYPKAPLDAVAMYKYLLEVESVPPDRIIVMGDSAGAGLSLAMMLRLRDEDPSLLPLAGMFCCPFVDLGSKGDNSGLCIFSHHIARSFGDTYFRGEGSPATWGDASPIHCDLHSLPPVYIQGAAFDFFLSHSKRLVQKAHDTGLSNWTLEVFPNMPHVFSTTPVSVLPEAGASLDAFAGYAADRFITSIRNGPSDHSGGQGARIEA